MKFVAGTVAVGVLLLSAAPACAWSTTDAALSGTVRDAQGTPQMGALVELLGADTSVIARAFTDDHGRYLLPAVLPGNYQLRASAAFLMPAVRNNLRLRAGIRAVADLSMTALFQAANWLPAQRRSTSEPADDWQWTLRATANRPLLRWVDSSASGSSTAVSSSADHRTPVMSEGQVTLLAGDGNFGQGGAHQVLALDHTSVDGDVSVLRASVQDDAVSSAAGGSFAVAGGVERQRPFGGGTRLFVSVASHPELQTPGGGGLQVMRTAATEKVPLGDAVIVDAGTLFTAEHLLGTRFESAPYVRVAFHMAPDIALEYRLATDRNLQCTEDLDRAALPEYGLSDAEGRPVLHRALHQEVVATETGSKHVVSVAVFRDQSAVAELQGGGLAGGVDSLRGLAAIADPSTGTVRLAVQGFTTNGMRVVWTQNLSPAVSASVDAELGRALAAGTPTMDAVDLPASVHTRTTGSVSAAMQWKARRTGTLMNVRYRWQPESTLTQVDEFDTANTDAYLGVNLKQRLWSGRRLKGVNAVIEATNLLAQGYEPLLSADGQTLFLAQVPRGVVGGLAFSF